MRCAEKGLATFLVHLLREAQPGAFGASWLNGLSVHSFRQPGAGRAVGVQSADELVVAGALVHQVRDREVHGGLRSDRQVGTSGSFNYRRADHPSKAATTGSPP
jgi:hypothetical protein